MDLPHVPIARGKVCLSIYKSKIYYYYSIWHFPSYIYLILSLLFFLLLFSVFCMIQT